MKKVLIKLGNGNLGSGFNSVNIELKEDDLEPWSKLCSLRAAPDLKSSLNQWELLYKEIVRLNRDEPHRGVTFAEQAITNVSIQDLRNLHDRLKIELNKWLDESEFSRIEKSLRTRLNATEEIIVVIQASVKLPSDRSIWQLPWYLWNFFTDYPLAVEVFSNPENINVSNLLVQPNTKVDILALFGTDSLLNLDRDFQCLQSLPDANLKPFETTSAQDIVDRLNLDSPDILYISGHGESVEYERELEGVIYLNPQTSLEISTLKPAIKNAVICGLQIAIFNCCSGLGIAHQLGDVNIPYLIVMRAEIPNRIAQEFLEKLLLEYSNGADFVRAFQLARDRISISTESWLKFANWLPVLFHNPLSHPVSWQDFIETTKSESTPRYRLWTSLGLSLVLAGLSMGLKSVEPIDRIENIAIDLLSQFQLSEAENVIIIKPLLTVSGQLNNPQTLIAGIKTIKQYAKPQAFITDNNLARYLPSNLPERQWRLNNRIFDRLRSISIENVSELSPAQVKDIFNDKIIIMGERDLLINKPLTANRIDLNSSLNLLKIPSKSEEFIWIFVWCNLSRLVVWQIGTRLFVPITISVVSSQIILGGVLLMMGNGVPIAITSIAIISAGTIIFKLD